MTAETGKFAILSGSVQKIVDGHHQEAAEDLMHLVNEVLDLDACPSDLNFMLYALALYKKLDPGYSETENMYLRAYGVPQADLFALLISELPFVYLSHPIANRTIGRFLAQKDEATLLDIGIGKAWQEVHLAEYLAKHDMFPRKLHIVGIEPHPDSLNEAEENLGATAERLNLDITFHPIQKMLEEFDEHDWANLDRYASNLVVNAAFAFHHIRDVGEHAGMRDEILSRLFRLNPAAFVLTEPDSDHHTTDLRQRFRNAWKHYNLVFDYLDGLDSVSDTDTNLIKIHFFGREIEDILGNSEENRSERHECTPSWIARAHRAGFQTSGDFPFLDQFSAPEIDIEAKDGFVSLGYKGATVVAIFCLTS